MRVLLFMCLLHAVVAQVIFNPWEGPGRTPPGQEPNADNVCSLDQGTCGCCLIIQQLNRLKANFNQTLYEMQQEASLMTQTLNNIVASRAAFSASLFADEQFRCFGPLDPNSNIVYKNAYLNLGAHYSVSTGVFTAPSSGVYTFAVSVYSDAGAPGNPLSACASLQVNNQHVAGAKDQNSNDQEDSATIAVVLQLRAKDQVAVKLPRTCFLCDDSFYNTFSGSLLYITE